MACAKKQFRLLCICTFFLLGFVSQVLAQSKSEPKNPPTQPSEEDGTPTLICPSGKDPDQVACVINRDEYNPGLICYNVDGEAKVIFDGYMNVHSLISERDFIFTVSDTIYVIDKETLETQSFKFSDFTWPEEKTIPQVYEAKSFFKDQSEDGGPAITLMDLERNGERSVEVVVIDGEENTAISVIKNLEGAEWIVSTTSNTGMIGGSFGVKKVKRSGDIFNVSLVIAPSRLGSDFGTIKNTTAAFYVEDTDLLVFSVTDSSDESSAIYTYEATTATLTLGITDSISYMIPRGGLLPMSDAGDSGLIVSAGDHIEGYEVSDDMSFPLSYGDLNILTVTNPLMHDTGQIIFTDICGGTPEEGPYTTEACDGSDNDGDLAVDENLTQDCVGTCGQPGESTCVNGVWSACVDLDTYSCGAVDNCPNDSLKTEDGICGCDVADDDLNANGIIDCIEPTPTEPTAPIILPTIPNIPAPSGDATTTSSVTTTNYASGRLSGGIACSLNTHAQSPIQNGAQEVLLFLILLGVIGLARWKINFSPSSSLDSSHDLFHAP